MLQIWTLYLIHVWYLIARRRNERKYIIWASEASKGYFDNVQIKMRYWKCWNRLNDKNKNIINRLVVKQKLWYLSTSIELTTLMKHFVFWCLWRSQCIDIFETHTVTKIDFSSRKAQNLLTRFSKFLGPKSSLHYLGSYSMQKLQGLLH